MADKKRPVSKGSAASVKEVRKRFDKWKTYATGSLVENSATAENADAATALIWKAACKYADDVRTGVDPVPSFKNSTLKELARAAEALAIAHTALGELGSDARELLQSEAQTSVYGMIGGKRPRHPHAREIVARLFNESPFEQVGIGGIIARPYAISMSGDLEILAKVARAAATRHRRPRGSKPSHGQPLLYSCVLEWRRATGRFPVKTRDTDDANASEKIAPLYTIIHGALDAIELPSDNRPGTKRTSFFNAIGDAEAEEQDPDSGMGILGAPSGSLARREARRATRRAGNNAKVSK